MFLATLSVLLLISIILVVNKIRHKGEKLFGSSSAYINTIENVKLMDNH